jgi:hypothetical protein
MNRMTFFKVMLSNMPFCKITDSTCKYYLRLARDKQFGLFTRSLSDKEENVNDVDTRLESLEFETGLMRSDLTFNCRRGRAICYARNK